jgi:hypothetical protein
MSARHNHVYMVGSVLTRSQIISVSVAWDMKGKTARKILIFVINQMCAVIFNRVLIEAAM